MTRPCALPLEKSASPDAAISVAKRQMIDAFYHASPARIVEQHPLLSVTAVASASLAVTVIAHAPAVRKIATASVVQTFKSVMPIIRSYAMAKVAESKKSPEAQHAVG